MSIGISRRQFLIAGSAIGSGAFIAAWRHHGNKPVLSKEQKLLRSLIDTIIPADDFAGALDLKLDDKLQTEAQKQPQLLERIDRLIAAVDKTALSEQRQAFYKLDIDTREAMLTKLLDRKAEPNVRRDLSIVRKKLMAWYYTSDEGFASLNYQPLSHYPAYGSN